MIGSGCISIERNNHSNSIRMNRSEFIRIKYSLSVISNSGVESLKSKLLSDTKIKLFKIIIDNIFNNSPFYFIKVKPSPVNYTYQ